MYLYHNRHDIYMTSEASHKGLVTDPSRHEEVHSSISGLTILSAVPWKKLRTRRFDIEGCMKWGTRLKGQQKHPRHVMLGSEAL